MKNIKALVLVSLALCLSGCASKINVSPELQDIDPPDKIKNDYAGAKATLKNNEKNGEIKKMSGNYSVPVEGDMYEWTDQAIKLATKEIRQRGGDVVGDSGRDVFMTFAGNELTYNQWNYSSTCKGTLKIETGSGYSKEYTVTNTTGGSTGRACGGAITLSVIEFLNDKNIIEFMSGVKR